MKITEFANSIDPDEAAHNEESDKAGHNEPSHLDLRYLPSSLRILNMINHGWTIFNFADITFVVCFLAL